MMDKYLSIITNFGCHFGCPYCIVKNNHIDVPKTTIDSLDLLEEAIKFVGANIVSVSGGGDPLHNYRLHRAYYHKLFGICRKLDIPLEMHTSYIGGNNFPYHLCKRVVYHLHDYEQLQFVKRRGDEIIRVVFVVTENFTNKLIDRIAEYVQTSDEIDELSFRQMVDKEYRVTDYCREYLESGHQKLWWYILQNDYNTYFVNGVLYYKFSDIGAGGE